MILESKRSEIKNGIEVFVRRHLGGTSDFSMDWYLKSRGIADISVLSDPQKYELADGLIQRFILPRVSSSKASLARVELLSILGLADDGVTNIDNDSFDYSKGIPSGPLNSEAPAASHPLSPRNHRFGEEILVEFIKAQDNVIGEVLVGFGDRMKNEADREEAAKTAVTLLYGHMSANALDSLKERTHGFRLNDVVARSLATYVGDSESRETALRFAEKVGIGGGSDGRDAYDLDAVSKDLKDYFTDMNYVLLRKLKNENNIQKKAISSDPRAKNVLKSVMSHHFGLASERYLELAVRGVYRDDPDDEVNLINAVIYDCMLSLMAKDDVDQAYGRFSELFRV